MALNPGGGNGFPEALINVFEQQNYLETLIRDCLLPTYVFRPKVISPIDWFDANIGETKTFTRRALIAPNITPLNAGQNTGLDNGMTADSRAFEQWTAHLNRWPGFIPTFMTGQEALIADLYLDNVYAIAQKAANSLEMVCAQRLWQAYDSGDTFLTANASSSSLVVDNVKGFDTQFPTANYPDLGTPATVTATNEIGYAVISASTGLITSIGYITNAAPDAASVSYMQNGGIVFGNSGTLTASQSVTASKGDRVVAIDNSAVVASLASAPGAPAVGLPLNPVFKDGSYVVRPLATSGQMITTAAAMTAANVMSPTQMIPYAVSILARRGVPRLENGLYGCAIDATLIGQFFGDAGFERATATRWHSSPVFQDGIIAAGWGVEFTQATQIPNYGQPGAATGAFQLRHGMVFGKDVIAEHPWKGAKTAANKVARVGDIADERWAERIKFRTLAAIDTLGDVIKLAYDYIGDFVPATDKSSNPSILQTTDFDRYKRGVMLQAAASF